MKKKLNSFKFQRYFLDQLHQLTLTAQFESDDVESLSKGLLVSFCKT